MYSCPSGPSGTEAPPFQSLDFAEPNPSVHPRLMAALMRFSMGLHVSGPDLASVAAIGRNCSNHIIVVNDIWSFDKELRASQTGHAEGGALCSAVQILAQGTELSMAAAKRTLYALVREWELVYRELVGAAKVNGDCAEDLGSYVDGLEFQMSGNEAWSQITGRYK